MKKNKFIAVTMRVDFFKKRNEIRSSLDNKMLEWIKNIGFHPFLLPSIKHLDLDVILSNLKISGIIISGGNSIKKGSPRYEVEKKLLNYSIKNKIPVLGICHGMQMMSEIEGGKLKKIKNHVNKANYLINLSNNINYPKTVKCYHNDTIKNLSKNFRILCTCKKGSIEAISHKKLKWLGWMFHPERDKIFNLKLIKIARPFFQGKKI